jgi:hypothetical protein
LTSSGQINWQTSASMIQSRLQTLLPNLTALLDLTQMTPKRDCAVMATAVSSAMEFVVGELDRCRHPQRY